MWGEPTLFVKETIADAKTRGSRSMHTTNLRLLPQPWSSGCAYQSQTLKLPSWQFPHPALSQTMEFDVSGRCVSDFAKMGQL